MVAKSNTSTEDKTSSVAVLHSRDLVGDLSQVISMAAAPEKITEIKIVLPSLKFMRALMDLDTDNEAVNIVTEAWSIGLATSFIVHQNLMPLLSAEKLQNLPVSIKDHKGFDLFIITSDVISYADVALLKHGWILTHTNRITTNLALEHMQKHDLHVANSI